MLHVPRAVFIDQKPTVIGEVHTGTHCQLYHWNTSTQARKMLPITTSWLLYHWLAKFLARSTLTFVPLHIIFSVRLASLVFVTTSFQKFLVSLTYFLLCLSLVRFVKLLGFVDS